jgi:hypothetical protein
MARRQAARGPVPQLATLDNRDSKAWNRAYEAAAYAHTIQKDGKTWGKINVSDDELAHPLKRHVLADLSLVVGAELFWLSPADEGEHAPQLPHYDGDMTRNWTSYDYQTLREDVFMIGRDGVTTGKRYFPGTFVMRSPDELVQS